MCPANLAHAALNLEGPVIILNGEWRSVRIKYALQSPCGPSTVKASFCPSFGPPFFRYSAESIFVGSIINLPAFPATVRVSVQCLFVSILAELAPSPRGIAFVICLSRFTQYSALFFGHWNAFIPSGLTFLKLTLSAWHSFILARLRFRNPWDEEKRPDSLRSRIKYLGRSRSACRSGTYCLRSP